MILRSGYQFLGAKGCLVLFPGRFGGPVPL
jgi:hypothetical protein